MNRFSDDSITVLHLSRWLSSQGGGIQTYLAALDRCLDETPVRNRYAALKVESLPVFIDELDWYGSPERSKFRNAISLLRWLHCHRDQFDILHIHGVTDWHSVAGFLVCLSGDKRFVLSTHGALLDGALMQVRRFPRITVPLLKRAVRYMLRGAVRVLPTTEAEGEALMQLESRCITSVVCPGVDVSRVAPRTAATGGRLRILFVGRVEAVKALEHLIMAVARLHRDAIDVRIDVLGACDTPYADAMRRLANREGIDECINWHGYAAGAEKQRWLIRSDVLVLPSLSENFGFVVAEAMAAGLPVVVSDRVGLAPLVAEAGAGLVFPVGDIEALKHALTRLLDATFSRQCAQNAHTAARAYLSMDRMRSDLLAIYKIAGGDPPHV